LPAVPCLFIFGSFEDIIGLSKVWTAQGKVMEFVHQKLWTVELPLLGLLSSSVRLSGVQD